MKILYIFLCGLIIGAGIMIKPLVNARRNEKQILVSYDRLFDYWNKPKGRLHHSRHHQSW